MKEENESKFPTKMEANNLGRLVKELEIAVEQAKEIGSTKRLENVFTQFVTSLNNVREKDKKKVLNFFDSATPFHVAIAQNTLGYCYKNGIGVEENVKKAVRLYRLSAEQGNVSAQKSLAYCYYVGIGVRRNDDEAVRLYRLAAEQGDRVAQFNLALCYERGIGGKKDTREVMNLYRLAADQGHKGAHFALAICYFNGTGIDKDSKEGIHWLRRAAAQGVRKATDLLCKKRKEPEYRDLIKQIEEAEKKQELFQLVIEKNFSDNKREKDKAQERIDKLLMSTPNKRSSGYLTTAPNRVLENQLIFFENIRLKELDAVELKNYFQATFPGALLKIIIDYGIFGVPEEKNLLDKTWSTILSVTDSFFGFSSKNKIIATNTSESTLTSTSQMVFNHVNPEEKNVAGNYYQFGAPETVYQRYAQKTTVSTTSAKTFRIRFPFTNTSNSINSSCSSSSLSSSTKGVRLDGS